MKYGAYATVNDTFRCVADLESVGEEQTDSIEEHRPVRVDVRDTNQTAGHPSYRRQPVTRLSVEYVLTVNSTREVCISHRFSLYRDR